MTWVRLDEDFANHPKLVQAGPLAMAMQVAALCYCNRYLTDGFVPRPVAATLLNLDGLGMRMWSGELAGGGEDATWKLVVEDLMDVGLWQEVEGGYRIHDYLDYQPSRAQVLADREQKREAGRRGGEASAQARAQAPAKAPADTPAQAKSKPVSVSDPASVSDPIDDDQSSSSSALGASEIPENGYDHYGQVPADNESNPPIALRDAWEKTFGFLNPILFDMWREFESEPMHFQALERTKAAKSPNPKYYHACLVTLSQTKFRPLGASP